ncbi:hypothetical protein LCGC14_1753970 [marine sediment metagenome]|uniref:Uncharacterized protein n=1 Tax=marine sediment metagenome TaxID=412755 RepID=A0A0F9JI74_9ZZZZ
MATWMRAKHRTLVSTAVTSSSVRVGPRGGRYQNRMVCVECEHLMYGHGSAGCDVCPCTIQRR